MGWEGGWDSLVSLHHRGRALHVFPINQRIEPDGGRQRNTSDTSAYRGARKPMHDQVNECLALELWLPRLSASTSQYDGTQWGLPYVRTDPFGALDRTQASFATLTNMYGSRWSHAPRVTRYYRWGAWVAERALKAGEKHPRVGT
jgi:hypothetical protein